MLSVSWGKNLPSEDLFVSPTGDIRHRQLTGPIIAQHLALLFHSVQGKLPVFKKRKTDLHLCSSNQPITVSCASFKLFQSLVEEMSILFQLTSLGTKKV